MSDELAATEPSRSLRATTFLRYVLSSGALSAAEIENRARTNHPLANGTRISTDKAFRLSKNEGGRT
jgi:hypothetical protein